ncbi:hypothetical protein ACFSCZ_16205, partial [Siminovitchia sediminis]
TLWWLFLCFDIIHLPPGKLRYVVFQYKPCVHYKGVNHRHAPEFVESLEKSSLFLTPAYLNIFIIERAFSRGVAVEKGV